MTLRDRALAVTPGGAQTRSKRATAFPIGFPQFLNRGQGAYVWDEAGKRYIDWIAGLAAISLGYGHGAVNHAVETQLRYGVTFSLPTALEVQVAETLREMLPSADMVRFVKTGSEATEGAMRIARLATGRQTIYSVGYHGWHTMHDAAATDHWGHPAATPGVPEALKSLVVGVAWGDLKTLESKMSTRPGAALLLEAVRDETPPAGYLEGIQAACRRTGTLLILDEMVTGFRWAIGGAGEFFGLQPDLACYGKAMANGFPLAAIVGRGDVMQHAAYVSGTFGGECISLAACQATLGVFRREEVIKHGWQIGAALMDGFNVEAKNHGLHMTGYAVHPRVIGERRDQFISAVAQDGVLFHPAGFNVMLAHGPQQVDETLTACRAALRRIE